MLSREYARQKYSEILGLPIEHAIVQNLEKHISNWAYLRSVDDKYYKCVQRYKHKFLSIYFNLKNSPNLKERILKGDIKTSAVINLSPQGLWPDGPHAKMTETNYSKHRNEKTARC